MSTTTLAGLGIDWIGGSGIIGLQAQRPATTVIRCRL
jgi:hypothetical protein